ncbi:MAG: RNA polymerase subunit sigma-24 [Chloroflexi bacterium]|nr:MAG: RNA polymerase subunit sigma-24 [Chloroflexota bacterium]RLC86751.1 MAG: RNA polymerase subunit sigma-24 [Chloroflexota bacterium]HEY68530.1 sigma-70 family RNA polymerase sigma factor [Thermoflexia bacterium]
MHEESDAELIARAKEDPEAFGLLYERYVGSIYNYIYYRTGNHHDAEDLTARTFYRALKHISRYVDRGAPFSAWLYRIAHNVVANWHRDTKRRQIISLDELVMGALKREDPATLTEEYEEQDMLLQAVRRLPPERQQLLILKFVEQMSNAEIAQVMGRTEGAIKSLYHRTLVALREDLISQENRREEITGRTKDE